MADSTPQKIYKYQPFNHYSLVNLIKRQFYFSKPEERGFIDSLNFKVNNEKIAWEFDKEHIDICKLILNKPLNPNDTISITTPFFVKIPDGWKNNDLNDKWMKLFKINK